MPAGEVAGFVVRIVIPLGSWVSWMSNHAGLGALQLDCKCQSDRASHKLFAFLLGLQGVEEHEEYISSVEELLCWCADSSIQMIGPSVPGHFRLIVQYLNSELASPHVRPVTPWRMANLSLISFTEEKQFWNVLKNWKIVDMWIQVTLIKTFWI